MRHRVPVRAGERGRPVVRPVAGFADGRRMRLGESVTIRNGLSAECCGGTECGTTTPDRTPSAGSAGWSGSAAAKGSSPWSSVAVCDWSPMPITLPADVLSDLRRDLLIMMRSSSWPGGRPGTGIGSRRGGLWHSRCALGSKASHKGSPISTFIRFFACCRSGVASQVGGWDARGPGPSAWPGFSRPSRPGGRERLYRPRAGAPLSWRCGAMGHPSGRRAGVRCPPAASASRGKKH